MALINERRTAHIAESRMVGVVGKPFWTIETTGSNSTSYRIQSRQLDEYLKQLSAPIPRREFMEKAEGWIRHKDYETIQLADFRIALARLVAILLHRGEEPEQVLKEKGLL